jgi:alpha-D-xyloside xylohydrolase
MAEGGRSVNKAAPIDILPLYVRAGSIIPWGPAVQYAAEKKWDELEVRVYPGANGHFTLYEDEGDSYNYESGAFSEIGFHWDDGGRTLTIDHRKGGFQGMAINRKFKIVAGNTSRVVIYKGKMVKLKI